MVIRGSKVCGPQDLHKPPVLVMSVLIGNPCIKHQAADKYVDGSLNGGNPLMPSQHRIGTASCLDYYISQDDGHRAAVRVVVKCSFGGPNLAQVLVLDEMLRRDTPPEFGLIRNRRI